MESFRWHWIQLISYYITSCWISFLSFYTFSMRQQNCIERYNWFYLSFFVCPDLELIYRLHFFHSVAAIATKGSPVESFSEISEQYHLVIGHICHPFKKQNKRFDYNQFLPNLCVCGEITWTEWKNTLVIIFLPCKRTHTHTHRIHVRSNVK